MTKRTTTRASTADRATGPPDGAAVIHTVEQLGPKMSRLPNGSLLCRDVPIGRVGWMMYGRGETPVEPAPGSPVAYVQRTADELFDAEAMGSFVGAAVVDEHPADDVTPANWKLLAKGHALNVRAGTGDDADVLLADLLITDAGLIRSVLAGKREVSLGYDADYHQTAPGVGMQTRLLGNHIALVEKGRCGPRCAIGDREFNPNHQQKENDMPKERVRITPRTRMATADRQALELARQKVADAAAELEELEAATTDSGGELEDGDGTHFHIHMGDDPKDKKKKGAKTDDEGDDPYEERMAALEQGQTQLADGVRAILAKIGEKSKGTKDAGTDEGLTAEQIATRDAAAALEDGEGGDAKAGDSKALETGYKTTLAQAEVLVPGIRVPTFDAAAKRVDTVAAMCKLRRRALDACMLTDDGAKLIGGIAGSEDVDIGDMPCKDVAVLFRAASTARALANNGSATRDDGSAAAALATGAATPGMPSIAEVNEAHRKFWEARTPRG